MWWMMNQIPSVDIAAPVVGNPGRNRDAEKNPRWRSLRIRGGLAAGSRNREFESRLQIEAIDHTVVAEASMAAIT